MRGGPIDTNNSDANHAVLNAKPTDEGWDLHRLVSLVLKSQFCMKMNTDEGWNIAFLFLC